MTRALPAGPAVLRPPAQVDVLLAVAGAVVLAGLVFAVIAWLGPGPAPARVPAAPHGGKPAATTTPTHSPDFRSRTGGQRPPQ